MCLYPQTVTRVLNLSTGAYAFRFGAFNGDQFLVPCGKCLECLQQHSQEWAFRIVDELKANNNVGCMITLTYAESDNNLHKDDLQKFMKRLRFHFKNIKIRYFACGEYGSHTLRPHYHVILFGCDFVDDRYIWERSKRGYVQYRSPTLEKLWQLGFSTISEVNLYTAKYSAKYLQKLQPITDGRQQPFTVMSLKPGIGYNSINFEQIQATDKVYNDGRYVKTPRYYLKVAKQFAVDLEEVEENRYKKGIMFARSPEKLHELRKIAKIRLQK